MSKKPIPKIPQEPARKNMRGRSRRSIVFELYSFKMRRPVPYDSSIERDMILVLEADPEVIGFWAQPEIFTWKDATGRKRRYPPDFLIQFRDGWFEYREIKPLEKLVENYEFDGRRAEIKNQCADRGASFDVWTKAMVRAQPRFDNAKRIYFSWGPHLDERDFDPLREALRTGKPKTVGALLTQAGLPASSLHLVFALAATQGVGIAINEPIGLNSALVGASK